MAEKLKKKRKFKIESDSESDKNLIKREEPETSKPVELTMNTPTETSKATEKKQSPVIGTLLNRNNFPVSITYCKDTVYLPPKGRLQNAEQGFIQTELPSGVTFHPN